MHKKTLCNDLLQIILKSFNQYSTGKKFALDNYRRFVMKKLLINLFMSKITLTTDWT